MAFPEVLENTDDVSSPPDVAKMAAQKGMSPTTLQKVVKTVFLVIVWMCLGLFLEITGPTLIDLKQRTHSDYEAVATAVEGRSAGFFIGSVVGGVLVDKFGLFCELMVAMALDFGAVATVAVPWSQTTELVFGLTLMQGIFEGVINIAGQKMIINMWKERSSSPLHILHAGFGIGSFIIPLVANPFLAEGVPDEDTENSSSRCRNTTVSHISQSSTTGPEIYLKPSRIEFAYIIAAAIAVMVSCIFYIYHCMGGKEREAIRNEQANGETTTSDVKESLTFKQMFNPGTCAGGKLFYGMQILVLAFIFFFQAVGGERVAGKFIRAYSIDYLCFTKDDGSYINTVFWIVFTVGRALGLVTAKFIPIRILIILETGGALAATICLVLFGGDSTTAFWIVMPVLGFFLAPLFPSGIGWTNFHIQLTGIGITILLLGGSLGGLAYMKLIGFLYEHYGPRSFLYTLLGYGIAVFALSVLMDLVGSSKGIKFVQNSEEQEEKVEKVEETNKL